LVCFVLKKKHKATQSDFADLGGLKAGPITKLVMVF
jgi:hypothetical protein